LKEGDGIVQLLQIWINLPSDKKKLDPSFRHYASASLPVIEKENKWIKILLGEYDGKKSPIETQTPLFLYHLKIKKGELLIIPVSEDQSAALYIMNGKIKVLNEEAKAGQLVDFHMDGNQLAFSATEDAELIVFGGLPIREKVVSYGPFVMNSFQEVQAAIADYETGKMGALDF
jgi:redox-sensitive bicupin YhaK (pirin superfamily)